MAISKEQTKQAGKATGGMEAEPRIAREEAAKEQKEWEIGEGMSEEDAAKLKEVLRQHRAAFGFSLKEVGRWEGQRGRDKGGGTRGGGAEGEGQSGRDRGGGTRGGGTEGEIQRVHCLASPPLVAIAFARSTSIPPRDAIPLPPSCPLLLPSLSLTPPASCPPYLLPTLPPAFLTIRPPYLPPFLPPAQFTSCPRDRHLSQQSNHQTSAVRMLLTRCVMITPQHCLFLPAPSR
ncbi:unnamed protein product [Closterium sp. Naga37s-1]|nr:unnamed protein product [Closterium sp. Naga37s-1]